MKSLFSLLLLIAEVSVVTSQREPTDTRGTTRNIEQVFKGRCWDYDVTKYIGLLPRVTASCDKLWDSFFQGFSYRPPCAVAGSGYDQFFSLAKQELPKDKVLFWSGVYGLAHRFAEAGRKYVTLEDTMVGYLVNSLTFCGQSIDPGMNYTRCPVWNDCPSEASESFWAGATSQFAKAAKGTVTVMMDGSRAEKPPYDRNSLFGKYELPNLTKNVTLVRALVTYGLGQPTYDICDKGSLADLRDDVAAQGIDFVCIQEPSAVVHLQCVDDPQNKDCRLANELHLGDFQYKRDTPLTTNQTY